MSNVEHKKVTLTGSKKTLEQWKLGLKKKGWTFLKILTEGERAEQVVYALFQRSIEAAIKRQICRNHKWVRIAFYRRYESGFDLSAD